MPVVYDCQNCGHPVHKQTTTEVKIPEVRGFWGIKQQEVEEEVSSWGHFTGEEYFDSIDCPKRGCHCDEPIPIRRTHKIVKWKK